MDIIFNDAGNLRKVAFASPQRNSESRLQEHNHIDWKGNQIRFTANYIFIPENIAFLQVVRLFYEFGYESYAKYVFCTGKFNLYTSKAMGRRLATRRSPILRGNLSFQRPPANAPLLEIRMKKAQTFF